MKVLLLAAALSIHAIDGDTVRLDGETIRLSNTDAPEIHGRCDAERRLAIVAKRELQRLLESGPVEIHVGKRSRDRYGRTLATLTVNGVDVGETMIGESLARRWHGRREPWCEKETPNG